jgi:hypothetical protein
MLKLRTERGVIDNKFVTIVGKRALESLPDPRIKKISQAYEMQSEKTYKSVPVWDSKMENLLLNI